MVDKRVVTDDLWAALLLWRRVDTSKDNDTHFEDFLGVSAFDIFYADMWTMLVPPQSGDRLQLLLSPHGPTVIKTWLARK